MEDAGNMKGALCPETLRDTRKRTLEKDRLSLGVLRGETGERGPSLGRLKDM